jgi:hypothetical protein
MLFARSDRNANTHVQQRLTKPVRRGGHRPLVEGLEDRTLLSFAPAETFRTGSFPLFGAAADFNHDGKSDLAVANRDSASVSILLGNGDGTFQADTEYHTASGAHDVGLGDFNGDGELDLAVPNQFSANLSVLLGNGDGTFQDAVNFDTDAHPLRVAVGDFNGDDKLDLATVNLVGTDVSVLLGNGDGTFQPKSDYAVGTNPNGLTMGDLNGDGKLDLIAANTSIDTVGVLLGNGDGTFQPEVEYDTGSGPTGLALADLNQDGSLDLAVCNDGTTTVSVLLGNGDGTFQSKVIYGVDSGPYGIAVADCDGDGSFDVAVSNVGTNDISVLQGNGDGTFQAAVNYPTGSRPYSMVAGDFNNDGAPDLATGDVDDGEISVLLNQNTVAPTIVTNNNDSGPGSLRQAILNANANPGLDAITFGIGTGAQTITPLSALPEITDPVVIDGSTQPGFTGSPLIELSGANAGSGVNGLTLTTGGSTIQGLVINRFSGDGNLITGSAATGNVIQGNYIGTDVTGTTALANAGNGVSVIEAAGITIGGTTSGAGNVISGNAGDGIFVQYMSAPGGLIAGNKIGTNAAGSAALANQHGVYLNGTAGLVIGGTTPEARNVISGNSGVGIYMLISSNNSILGNYLGIDAAGTHALGSQFGCLLYSDTNITIGGTALGAGNVISSNGVGVSIQSSHGVVVQGNLIGTDATGNSPLGNYQGIQIQGGSANTIIGGTVAGAGNVIAASAADGIVFYDYDHDNAIQGNWIGTNAAGASLGNDIGVHLYNSSTDNVIGGTAAGASNFIDANYDGIVIGLNDPSPSGDSGNRIEGNLIGLDPDGNTPLGNIRDGVRIMQGASGNTIGGRAAGAGNIIAFNGRDGVSVTAGSGNSIDQNAIYSNGNDGILLSGTAVTGNVIQGNFIGTNPSGTAALGNGGNGIELTGGSGGNTIGGTLGAATRNVISGNAGSGIYIVSGSGNSIAGNYIGTNAAGTAGLANSNGIYLIYSANNNTIGGTTPEARNVISGNSNGSNGVGIYIQFCSNNFIMGNYVGTDAAGTHALGNYHGCLLYSDNDITIGGTALGAGNVISGNLGAGVSIQSSPGVVVQGNLIGTDATGNAPLGNFDKGIYIGSTFDTIGGTAPGAGNVIAATGNDGIAIVGFGEGTVHDNIVQGNWIGTNAAGVSLGNGRFGVFITIGAANNLIGGTATGAGNVIDANEFGIRIDDNQPPSYGDTTGNRIEGNLIGVAPDGNTALGNLYDGVQIVDGASGNTVGGTAVGAGNIIAFNGRDGVSVTAGSGNSINQNAIYSNGNDGILLSGAAATGNVIQGNYIGTNAAGTAAQANGGNGIELTGGSGGNTIGGTFGAATRNVISGNAGSGVYIVSGSGNSIVGNYIGTNAAGTAGLANANGIYLIYSANNNTIGGTTPEARNVISGNSNGFNGVGIYMQFCSDNFILGNYVGTDAAGTHALGNFHGCLLYSDSDITIGGTAPGAGNVISANLGAGVSIQSSPGVVVQGNLIGTDATGNAPLGNYDKGIFILSSNDTIGGTAPGAGNVIAATANDGIAIAGFGGNNCHDIAVQGNWIGTNAAGVSMGNGGSGVVIELGAVNNLIGGTSAGAGNIIDANQLGILIIDNQPPSFGDTTGNRIEGNLIGVAPDGNSALGNLYDGVWIKDGASGNTVGGTADGAGNIIAFNGRDGVSVSVGSGNSINQNAIYSNGNLGIKLSQGGNNGQAAPALTMVSTSGSGTVVTGTLAGPPGATYRLEFFANETANAAGNWEGQNYLGSASVTLDAVGNFTTPIPAATPSTQPYVTATATSARGDTSEFSNSRLVSTGAVQLSVSAPSNSTAGDPFSVTVTALSGSGNVATDYVGTIELTSSDPAALLPIAFTFTPDDAGVHTFTNGATLRTAGSQTLTATDTATATLTGSATVVVNPAAADHLILSAPGDSNAGGTSSITVTAVDAFGNTATGYRGTVSFTSSDPQAQLPGDSTFTGADGGMQTLNVTLFTAGSQTLRATDTVTSSITGNASIIVHPAGATSLNVTGFLSPTTAGDAHNFTVTAHDAYGNVASGYRGMVHFTSTDSQATLPGDYAFTSADAGAHVFSATLKTVGTQSLTATDTVTVTLAGTQAGIVVNPAAASAFTVVGFASPTTAGSAQAFTVTAIDPYGNRATGYRGTVHFTSSDSQAALPVDYAFTATDNGVRTFNATLKTAGSQSLTATDSLASSITGSQAGITVNPAAAQTLRVAGFPSPTTAGVAQAFIVSSRDAYGNVATGYRGRVRFTSTDPQAVLPANYTFTSTDAGQHTFSATLKTVGTRPLTAIDTVTGSITGTQAGIVVNSAAASTITVAGFPSPTTAGVAQAFSVTAKDVFGNVATGYTGTVHFTSSDAQAALPANYMFAAGDNGAHAFSATLKTAATQSLTATDTVTGTLTGSQSGIVATAATASSFSVTGFPFITTAGIAHNFTVSAQDPFGNRDTNYRGTVHFTSTDPQATLPANYTFKPGDKGVQAFSATLKTAGFQSLTVADTVSSSITGTEAGIDVRAAAATILRVTTVVSTTIAGSSFLFTVTARDAYGNIATGYRGTVHFTSTDGAASLPSNYTFTSGDSGAHLFTATLRTRGTQSITATDTATPSVTGTLSGIRVVTAPLDLLFRNLPIDTEDSEQILQGMEADLAVEALVALLGDDGDSSTTGVRGVRTGLGSEATSWLSANDRRGQAVSEFFRAEGPTDAEAAIHPGPYAAIALGAAAAGWRPLRPDRSKELQRRMPARRNGHRDH